MLESQNSALRFGFFNLETIIGCFAKLEMPKAIQQTRNQRTRPHIPKHSSDGRWVIYHRSKIMRKGTRYNQLEAALKFMSRYFGTEDRERQPISWAESRRCLDLIKLLDKKPSIFCHLLAPCQSELSVHREFARLKVRLFRRHICSGSTTWRLLDGFHRRG